MSTENSTLQNPRQLVNINKLAQLARKLFMSHITSKQYICCLNLVTFIKLKRVLNEKNLLLDNILVFFIKFLKFNHLLYTTK